MGWYIYFNIHASLSTCILYNANRQKCFNVHQSWLTTVICKLTRIWDNANSDQAAKKQLNHVTSIHLYRRCHFHWIKGYNRNVKLWLYFLLQFTMFSVLSFFCDYISDIWVGYTIITSSNNNVHNGHYSPKRNILRSTSISIKQILYKEHLLFYNFNILHVYRDLTRQTAPATFSGWGIWSTGTSTSWEEIMVASSEYSMTSGVCVDPVSSCSWHGSLMSAAMLVCIGLAVTEVVAVIPCSCSGSKSQLSATYETMTEFFNLQ